MALVLKSTKPKVGAVTNIVAEFRVDPALKAKMDAKPETQVTKANEQFVGALFYFPEDLFKVLASTKFTAGVPSNVSQLLSRFTHEEVKSMMEAAGVSTEAALKEALEGSDALETELAKAPKAPKTSASVYESPSIKDVINPSNNLHLLLANPVVATVVMEQRKRQTAAALAKPVLMPAGSPFGLPFGGPGLSVSITSGMKGGADLDYSHPIEMRGAGPMIAAMRGGMYPFMLGTASSPTSWTPVSDRSFISASLRMALASLMSSLKSKNYELSDTTKNEVNSLITKLEEAERSVVSYRDNLTSINNAIASGHDSVNKIIDGNKDGSKIELADVTRIADEYNNAMKMRQKLENKLFRVVVALGGKVVASN